MKSIGRFSLLLATVLLVCAGAVAGENKNRAHPPSLGKLNDYKYFDVNQINAAVNSDGTFADERKTGASGMEWPKGSGKTCVYTAGLWLAGIHRPTGYIRTANQDYASEYQPGPLLETFNTTTNIDDIQTGRSYDNKYRLYKINTSDAKAPAGTNPDYDQWPGDLGAPYIDVNGDGQWTPGVDLPKFYGDQQLWTVTNDASNARHQAVGATPPMGVEVQFLFFGFNRPGALGNMAFLKYKIINKSDADYDNVYVSQWSDVDLGDGNDDLPGCDTTYSLGYVYNGGDFDGTPHGYGSKPAADGFDFFEGPKVPAGPNDSAIVDGKWYKGFKNLPMTSYVVYTNTTFAQIQDPPAGSPTFASIAYDYQRGLAGTVHQTLISPTSHQPMYKWFSGDPVAGTGDLPTNFPLGLFKPQDIRIMLTSGPFTLAKGDTQEVVVAFLAADGQDRLSSVTLLKTYDLIAQDAFNSNFNLPSAPPLPNIKVTELPNQIELDWSKGSDVTEAYNFKSNVFQGYNLYQGASSNGPWTRIQTWDIIDSVATIIDYTKDPVDGNYYLNPVEYGTNSGLSHKFLVNQDYVSGGPLVNGKPYFFSLTTYAFNVTPGARDKGLPLSLEAAQNAIKDQDGNYCTPRQPAIGTTIPTLPNQVLVTDRSVHADFNLQPKVFDPTLLTGGTYTASVNGSGTNVTSWNLLRTIGARTDTVVKNNTDFSGTAPPYVDGLTVSFVNPAQGPRTDDGGVTYEFSANQWLSATRSPVPPTSLGAFYPYNGLALDPVSSKGSSVPKDQLRRVEIRFGGTQQAYRYLRNVSTSLPKQPIVDPSFIPWVKKTGKGFVYQGDYSSITVPFTVWDTDTLQGGPIPRQLNVGFLETNDTLYGLRGTTQKYLGNGRIDGIWDPTTADNGGIEPLFIFNSTYSTTENPKYTVPNIQAVQDSIDILYILSCRSTDSSAAFKSHAGDKIVIRPNYVLNASRTYAFTAPAVTANDPTAMKRDLNLVNVFPNPYFAHNMAEAGLYNRFVTFSHLPYSAKITVFTIVGDIVRTIQHSNASTYEQWDLRNANGLPVASGVYIVTVEIPNVGTKILKLAIVQPEERPTRI